jgi:hypothetical protein
MKVHPTLPCVSPSPLGGVWRRHFPSTSLLLFQYSREPRAVSRGRGCGHGGGPEPRRQKRERQRARRVRRTSPPLFCFSGISSTCFALEQKLLFLFGSPLNCEGEGRGRRRARGGEVRFDCIQWKELPLQSECICRRKRGKKLPLAPPLIA